MHTLRAALVISALLFFAQGFAACGGGGTGGTGGSGAGSTATAGTGGSGAGTGSAGTNGGAGTAGATGTGGASAGSCQACVACINANCASAITTCRANTGCNAIYMCASACVMTIEECVAGDLAAALMWAQTVSGCYSSSCRTQCTY